MGKDKEYNQLVCIDLSARLPYGVKVQYNNEIFNIDYISALYEEVKLDILDRYTVGISEIKPYLRPMGDMTEDECDMVEEILGEKCVFDFMQNGDIVLHKGNFTQETLAKLYDYFNSIHVDYRGLIEKGFALEAPKGMYDTKKSKENDSD